jgi:hypothetical protein
LFRSRNLVVKSGAIDGSLRENGDAFAGEKVASTTVVAEAFRPGDGRTCCAAPMPFKRPGYRLELEPD